MQSLQRVEFSKGERKEESKEERKEERTQLKCMTSNPLAPFSSDRAIQVSTHAALPKLLPQIAVPYAPVWCTTALATAPAPVTADADGPSSARTLVK